MKNIRTIAAALLCVAMTVTAASASPRKKAKKDTKPKGPTVEERIAASRHIGTDIKPSTTVYLYPKGQGVDQGIIEKGFFVTEGPLESNGLTGPERPNGEFIANVTDSARIDLYFPEHPNGQMVLVAPGGSYSQLASVNEGIYVAKWLTDRNITCGVVKYRMPNGHWNLPLRDMQNALRYCRFHAAEWGVSQIGIIGFSAGGHLVTTVETQYVDDVTRPDFAIPVYARVTMYEKSDSKNNLIGKTEDWAQREGIPFEEWYENQKLHEELLHKYTATNNVTSDTPPTFIAVSSDDKLVTNSIHLYEAMVNNGVPVEMHVYPYGGHGWGFTEAYLGNDRLRDARHEFSVALERWLTNLRTPYEAPQDAREKSAVAADKTILLYPEGQDVDKGIVENGVEITQGPCVSNEASGAEIVENGLLRNVGDSARFDLYLPKNGNGQMIIVCPGGGYWVTAQYGEGVTVADWFTNQGIAVAVMKYRLPMGHWEVPLTDVQNAFRYCRAHAQEWGVDQIGVIGFSAGGHLAACTSTLYVDSDTRPDFSVLIYPFIAIKYGTDVRENLIGKDSEWIERAAETAIGRDEARRLHDDLIFHYSPDNQITPGTPKTFIALSSDDDVVPVHHSTDYLVNLIANGVSCELHSFPKGGHGWGFTTNEMGKDNIGEYRQDFFNSLSRFLNDVRKNK